MEKIKQIEVAVSACTTSMIFKVNDAGYCSFIWQDGVKYFCMLYEIPMGDDYEVGRVILKLVDIYVKSTLEYIFPECDFFKPIKVEVRKICVIGISMDDCLSHSRDMGPNTKLFMCFPDCEARYTGIHFNEIVLTYKGRCREGYKMLKERVESRLLKDGKFYIMNKLGEKNQVNKYMTTK